MRGAEERLGLGADQVLVRVGLEDLVVPAELRRHHISSSHLFLVFEGDLLVGLGDGHHGVLDLAAHLVARLLRGLWLLRQVLLDAQRVYHLLQHVPIFVEEEAVGVVGVVEDVLDVPYLPFILLFLPLLPVFALQEATPLPSATAPLVRLLGSSFLRELVHMDVVVYVVAPGNVPKDHLGFDVFLLDGGLGLVLVSEVG